MRRLSIDIARSVSKFSKQRGKPLMSLNRGKLPTPQATVLKKIIMVVVVVHQIINPRCQAEAEGVDLV